MFHLDFHQQRVAELLRRAEQDRLVREALGARRAARRPAARRSSGREPDPHESGTHESGTHEPDTHEPGPRRTRFTPAA